MERTLSGILRVGVMNSLGNNNHLLAGLQLSPDPILKDGLACRTGLTPKTKGDQPKEENNMASSHDVTCKLSEAFFRFSIGELLTEQAESTHPCRLDRDLPMHNRVSFRPLRFLAREY